MDREQFAIAAAEVFAYVNHAHPFREGNGRTSKLFMQHVAELSPFRIDYSAGASQVTAEVWNQASMMAGPDLGTYEPVPASLVPVFRALTVDGPAPAAPATPEQSRGMASRRASYPRPAADVLGDRSTPPVAARESRPADDPSLVMTSVVTDRENA
jgi:cell filamentation protein